MPSISLLKLKLWLCIAIIPLSAVSAGGAEVVLVDPAGVRAEIIVAEDALPSVKLAGKELQTFISRISGQAIPIVDSPTRGFGVVPIFVGESSYTHDLGFDSSVLPVEGFILSVQPEAVVVMGHDEERAGSPFNTRTNPDANEAWAEFSGTPTRPTLPNIGHFNRALGFHTLDATATLYAASELLELLGVRFYAPYEDGTVVPRMATVALPVGEISRQPHFTYRELYWGNGMQSDADAVMWTKHMKYGASEAYGNNAHSLRNIAADPIIAEHPEFFAHQAGKMVVGHDGAVPKLSDPGFRDYAFEYLLNTFKGYPSARSMTLGMPDGYGQIDEDDARIWVKDDATAENRFSNYVWDFWLDQAARLQEAMPGKLLNTYAYTSYAETPEGVDKLPDNIAVTMAYGAAISMLPLYENYYTPLRERWLELLTSRKLFIWEYSLFYRRNAPTVPVIYTAIMQQDTQRLQGVAAGKFTETSWARDEQGRLLISYPALTHLNYYLQGKLYWDPDLDLDALLSEYYNLYYGPAGDIMGEFYTFAEDVWTRTESRSITPSTGYLRPQDIERYFDLLDAAMAKAGGEGVYYRRIKRLHDEMAPVKTLFDRLQRSGPRMQGLTRAPKASWDGDLQDAFWSEGPVYSMRTLVEGDEPPPETATEVRFRMTPDRSKLVIGVKCYEPLMGSIHASTTAHDDAGIFDDDTVEIYLESPERSYFKIVVNSNGSVWDESFDGTILERDTQPLLWNPGVEVAVVKGDDYWSVEIVIPTSDIGNTTLGPNTRHPWGINVCRARYAGGETELFAVSPTGEAAFKVLPKLGFLSIQ